ncbi:4-amino-4-deoxychorismate lyase [Evansella vedderi]|uniref:4-amino-4-deoxychorismate lyase n=1 Tax=Evansella vedderi TaxID=38282 RepID=A0ABU0A321_9BACI|nr:aminodeoxychorismate lyase [Evansella vedderi]MDQ0257886.1 4-amino-4-deoxychorismate lyase [Evansella vedderi]
MYLFLNGSIKHQHEAAISPLDHGYLYGLGLFETFRTYHGHPFLLDDHFSRLYESAEIMGIQVPPYNRKETVGIIQELLEVNEIEDGYFRWNLSAGERGIGLSTENYTEPNTIVFVKPLPDSRSSEKNGIFLKQRRNTPEGSVRFKSHHYLNNILAKREVGMEPNVEGIFLTEGGFISEGIVSNIFWWKRDTLYTPSIQTAALNGITRQFIIALAPRLGMNVEEGCYLPHHLRDAEEVFVTNSIQELVPLKNINDYSYKGKKGNIYSLLHKHYKQKTGSLWSRIEL